MEQSTRGETVMELTTSGMKRAATLMEQPELRESVMDMLMRWVVSGKIAPEAATFGRRASDRVAEGEWVHQKKADALEAILRRRGAPLAIDECAKLLREGGCKMPDNPKYDYRVLCIAIAANPQRFVQDGNRVALRELG